MLALWDGPASVAVYIPIPRSSPEAPACRERVVEYLAATADKLRAWRQERADAAEAPSDHPLHVSFLYATAKTPNMGCELTEESTGLDPGTMDEALWREQFEGKPYIDIYDAEYPVGALRQLALDAVRPDCAARGVARACAPVDILRAGGVPRRSRTQSLRTCWTPTSSCRRALPRPSRAARAASSCAASAPRGARTASATR